MIEKNIEKLRRETQSLLVEKALEIACKAHKDQKRKGDGSPYIAHPVSVALKLSSAGFPENVVASAP